MKKDTHKYIQKEKKKENREPVKINKIRRETNKINKIKK